MGWGGSSSSSCEDDFPFLVLGLQSWASSGLSILTLQRQAPGILQRTARGHSPSCPPRKLRNSLLKISAISARMVAQFVFKILPQIALSWLRHVSTFQNPADSWRGGYGSWRGGERREVGKRVGEAWGQRSGSCTGPHGHGHRTACSDRHTQDGKRVRL